MLQGAEYRSATFRDKYEEAMAFLERHANLQICYALDTALRGGRISGRYWDVVLLEDESGGLLLAEAMTYSDAYRLARSLNSVALDPNEVYAVVFDPENNAVT